MSTEELNGCTAFITAAKTPLVVSSEERTEEGLHDEQTTSDDALRRQATPFWIMLFLIVLFDSFGLIIVLLTLAVQNQSPIFLNPTNVAVPWPNAVYIPWFVINIVGFGCGIFVSVFRRNQPSLMMFTLFVIVVDVILFTNILDRNARVVMFTYFWNTALVHVVAWVKWTAITTPSQQKIDAVRLIESIRNGLHRSLRLTTALVVIVASFDIIQSFWSLTTLEYDGMDEQGLPLSPNFFMLWWMVIVISRLCTVVGACLNRNYVLVGLGMIGCFVDIALFLFRRITLSDNSTSLVSFCLAFMFALVATHENAVDRHQPLVTSDEETETHSDDPSSKLEV